MTKFKHYLLCILFVCIILSATVLIASSAPQDNCNTNQVQPTHPTANDMSTDIHVQSPCDDKDDDKPTHKHLFKLETIIKESSCQDEGEVLLVCECGATRTTRAPRANHHYQVENVCQATCEHPGYVLFRCVCGAATKEVIPQREHDFVCETTIPATCTKDGKITYACSCGTKTSVVLQKTGHDYVEVSRVAASCTKNGSITYICKCGDKKTEIIKKFGHTYQISSVVASTITVQGKQTYTCVNCTSSYSERLPLIPSPLTTDMCGKSLLNKPLPHDPYYNLAQQFFDIIDTQRNQCNTKESVSTIPLCNDLRNIDIQAWLGTKYHYAAVLYEYGLRYYQYSPIELTVRGDREAWASCQAIEQEVARILSELEIDNTVTQYEAIKRINDYMCENMYYEYDATLRDTTIMHSLTGQSGICYNYAVRFQLLCLGAGIECEYYPSSTMSHAWNKVIFSDGSHYWVDTCWNDAQYRHKDNTVTDTSVSNGVPISVVNKIRSRYLLITDEELAKTHTM
jgi:hypothetical protein